MVGWHAKLATISPCRINIIAVCKVFIVIVFMVDVISIVGILITVKVIYFDWFEH